MSAKKAFYLFKNNRENGIYYAEFIEPKTGRTLHRSTGSRDRDEAVVITAKWLAEGVPTRGRAAKPLAELFTFQALKAHMEKVYNVGELSEDNAVELCKTLRRWGLINLTVSRSGAGKQDFIEYLYNFYDYEKSVYIKDKQARGASVTRNYCIRTQQMIKREWVNIAENRI